MTDSQTDDNARPVTGGWYTTGRINVPSKITKKVPWENCAQVVILYDEKEDELRIKKLSYKR